MRMKENCRSAYMAHVFSKYSRRFPILGPLCLVVYTLAPRIDSHELVLDERASTDGRAGVNQVERRYAVIRIALGDLSRSQSHRGIQDLRVRFQCRGKKVPVNGKVAHRAKVTAATELLVG